MSTTPPHATAAQAFNDGNAAYRAEQWEPALAAYDLALAQDPAMQVMKKMSSTTKKS